MQKYPSNVHLEDKYKAARLSVSIKPKRLRCAACQRETKHDYSRVGANGPLFACRDCGTEQVAK
jgi:Zn finger protein HypA/HybF involved in hydrogenase expression